MAEAPVKKSKLCFADLEKEEEEKSTPQTVTKKKGKKGMESVTEKKEHLAILAVVQGQNQGAYDFKEEDIRKLFSGMALVDVTSEAGYWIIQFQDDDDRRKALRKNKQVYKNKVTILVGEYEEEDEKPEPIALERERSWQSDSFADRSGYERGPPGGRPRPAMQPKPQPFIKVGGNTQKDLPYPPVRSSSGGGGFGIKIGGRTQTPLQQPPPPPANSAAPSSGAYIPKHKRPISMSEVQREQPKATITAGTNKFGGLLD